MVWDEDEQRRLEPKVQRAVVALGHLGELAHDERQLQREAIVRAVTAAFKPALDGEAHNLGT